MSTSSRSALQLAIVLAQRPVMVRAFRKRPLPRGIEELLRIAAGDALATEAAQARMGLPPDRVRSAAMFFIEQILMESRADSYRVLGCEPNADDAELRQHVALLMRWLHPDVADTSAATLDRSVFVSRITTAWNDLKSVDRRAAYDATLRQRPMKRSGRHGQSVRLSASTDHRSRHAHPPGTSPGRSLHRWLSGVLGLMRRP